MLGPKEEKFWGGLDMLHLVALGYFGGASHGRSGECISDPTNAGGKVVNACPRIQFKRLTRRDWRAQ